MALIDPPLFMQTGRYSAAADRFLIGGLLAPSGGGSPLPRAGIRPSGIDSGSGAELAFRVTPDGNGTVSVGPGVAFVPTAEADKKFNGLYLVVNDAPQSVNVRIPQIVDDTNVVLYLQAVDAAFTAGDASLTAKSIFVVQGAGIAPPAGSLRLATITWKGDDASPEIYEDNREYTSSSGGVIRVQALDQLTGNTGSLRYAPYGTLAYVHDESVVYTQTVRGWIPVGERPAATVSSQPNFPASASLRVVQKTFIGHTWLVIPTGSPSAFLDFNDERITVTTIPASKPKPSNNDLSVWVRVFSANTRVQAVLSASGWVPQGNSLTGEIQYINSNANLAVDVTRWQNGQSVGPVINPATTEPQDYYQTNTYTSGLTFYAKMDVLKSRTINYQLTEPGDYLFKVKVYHHGDSTFPGGGFGVFQLHQAILEVSA